MRTPVKTPATPASARKVLRALKRGTKNTSRVPGSKHQTIKDPRTEFSEDEWHEMVATAAYYRAECRGFDGGSAEDDWYEAEAELREQLAKAERETEPNSNSDGNTADMEREVE